jgi:hypothetical protein
MITTGWTLVPFTQESLHEALRKMCPAALKAYDKATTDAMRAEWQPSNPTRFCCYFVSEMLYWYAFEDAHAMALKVPGDSTPHRFIAVETHCTSFALGGPASHGARRLDVRPIHLRSRLRTRNASHVLADRRLRPVEASATACGAAAA